MNVLAALTPPFLVCAVVIVAIVAFLRYEMGRGRGGNGIASDESSDPAATAPDEDDGGAGSGADTASSVRHDG